MYTEIMASVLVLAGGNSPERAVSLRSGAAVVAALQTAGHEVSQADPADGRDALAQAFASAQVVFPALHGEGGEDGELQKFLEDSGVAFVGSGSQASALCYDKGRYMTFVQSRNFPVPQTEIVDHDQYSQSKLATQPHVLKPIDGGSSIDTFIIRSVNETDQESIHLAFDRHHQLVLQELIEGTEITVAALDDESLPVIEIIPPEAGEFDYENKYNGASQELCPPEHVSVELQAQAQTMALQLHKITGCRHLSRTDFMINKSGQLFVLETNTIPGLTDQSLLPKAAATAGYTMPMLCDRLVTAALVSVT